MDERAREARNLSRSLTQKPTLTLEQAQPFLPDLAMAELAGEDVAERFAAVLEALAYYPELADEYELLLADLRLFHGE